LGGGSADTGPIIGILVDAIGAPSWSTTVDDEVRLEGQSAGVSQDRTGIPYLGIVKVLDVILGDHLISRLRRRKANRFEFLGR
jgi:hypothetical protein